MWSNEKQIRLSTEIVEFLKSKIIDTDSYAKIFPYRSRTDLSSLSLMISHHFIKSYLQLQFHYDNQTNLQLKELLNNEWQLLSTSLKTL